MTPLDHEFVVFSHRPHPEQARLAEALVRTTAHTVRLTVLREPGTAHQNMNRALDIAGRTRYVFLMDEDAIPLQPGWVPAMLSTIGRGDAGLVGCRDARTPEEVTEAVKVGVQPGPVEAVQWLPGYVMLVDRQRTAGLRIDEAIPGRLGMSDKDFCLQIRARGLRIYKHLGVVVEHLDKPPDDVIRKARDVSLFSENLANFELQVAYMNQKYGVGNW